MITPHETRWRYMFGDHPRVDIAAFPESGSGVVVGAIVSATGPIHRAPLTGRPCVYWQARVESHNGIRVLAHESGGLPFTIRDATGYALVDPRGAVALMHWDHFAGTRRSTGWRKRAEEAMLARHRLRSGHLLRRLVFAEAVFSPGETIAVSGAATRQPDPQGAFRAVGLRAAPPTRLHFGRSPTRPLLLSDDPELVAA